MFGWVWKGEEGEMEEVHVAVGNEASRRSEFPEFGHLLVEDVRAPGTRYIFCGHFLIVAGTVSTRLPSQTD
jgi:hypothetical protein